MQTDVLPGYTFDVKTHTYIDRRTGKAVAASFILILLRLLVQEAEQRGNELSAAYYEKQISAASFVEQMRTEQRRNTIQLAALAAGGIALLTMGILAKAESSLSATYPAIIGTAKDVADGKVSLGQLQNRVRGYVGQARRLFWQTKRDTQPQPPVGMVAIERRILGDADHCDQCPMYSDWSWQLAGTIPQPSEECDCKTHCRCHNITNIVPVNELDQWITKEKTAVEWPSKKEIARINGKSR